MLCSKYKMAIIELISLQLSAQRCVPKMVSSHYISSHSYGGEGWGGCGQTQPGRLKGTMMEYSCTACAVCAVSYEHVEGVVTPIVPILTTATVVKGRSTGHDACSAMVKWSTASYMS